MDSQGVVGGQWDDQDVVGGDEMAMVWWGVAAHNSSTCLPWCGTASLNTEQRRPCL